MPNDRSKAARWTEFIAERSEFPAGGRLLAAFHAGRITRICDCGCNAFELEMPEDTTVDPLSNPGTSGAVFELSFTAIDDDKPTEQKSLEFILFVDKRGHFTGIEVDFCGNSYPVPERVSIQEPPYHVRCSSEIRAA